MTTMTILTTLNYSGNVVSFGSKVAVFRPADVNNSPVFTGLNEDGAGDGNRTHVSIWFAHIRWTGVR